MPVFIDVDPGELHLPPSRAQGADPAKLARQIAQHGNSLAGMPPLQVVRGKDGRLRINDGVTRATRGQVAAGPTTAGGSDPGLAQSRRRPDAEGEGEVTVNNPSRAELLDALAALCREYPDWRLGQLVANVAGWADRELWDIEDEQLLAAARAHLEARTRREAEASRVIAPRR
jgi:hypothetical protein